jgi:hypothetical protein
MSLKWLLGLKADLASPAFTGVPTAPTAAPATNTTQLATTAYVDAAAGAAADADIIAIAGLTPSNDDLIQRKAGAWTNRTPAQVKTDLALVKGDVGLGNVDNTADTAKPVSTAQQTALDLKANLASPTFTGTPAAPTAADGTNTTQLATTAFVQTAVGVAAGVSGSYTPTLTNTTNVAASVSAVCQYLRIDDNVIVHGVIQIDPTAATTTVFGISLPIASNFGATTDGSGLMGSNLGVSGAIIASVANDRMDATFISNSTANQNVAFTFQYTVI